ncbi:MAG TPA: FHA domain-containing protein, partial [Burkholderiaceae bacterium]|nr:FHA domain-containing protein [Burkholderiaceae bacterium]
SFSSLAASAPAEPVAVAAPVAVSTISPDATQMLVSARVNADPVTAPVSKSVSAQRLLLRVVVDPVLYTDPDPESPCPTDRPEKVFHLDLDENTLGRQFEGKGVHPEIVVQDPSISRRHLKFIRGSSGQYSVLELGSANGSEFNGKTLEPGVVMLLNPGDQITLGMWTRIHVEAR